VNDIAMNYEQQGAGAPWRRLILIDSASWKRVISCEKTKEEGMAKEQKPVAQLSGIAERTIEQGRDAVDMYFDTLKRTISSYPTGGTEFGEKLKSYAETNISTTHEFAKRLSQAKDFQEMVGIQTEFMQSIMNTFGEQAKSLTDAYTQAAAGIVKKPLAGMS
jgi:hypothetical protein